MTKRKPKAKPEPPHAVTMYVLDTHSPWRKIKTVQAFLKVAQKSGVPYAVIHDRYGAPTRKVIDQTIFFTMRAAELRQHGMLDLLDMRSSWWLKYRNPEGYLQLQENLEKSGLPRVYRRPRQRAGGVACEP